jgi:hypothetical protein
MAVVVVVSEVYRDWEAHRDPAYLFQQAVVHSGLMVENCKDQRGGR